jgi:hypothetical protein
VPTGAGKLTAKLGLAAPLPARPPSGVVASVAPPASATLYGKTRPVGLAWLASRKLEPPHCTPIWRVKFDVASTMRASMITC